VIALTDPRAQRRVANIGLAALGVAAVTIGTGYGMFDERGQVGPGFMPVLAGSLMALFGFLDLGLDWRRRAVTVASEDAGQVSACTEQPDVRGRTARQRQRQLWIVFGLVLLALLLVPVVGFLISFGLLLFVCSYAVERQGLLPSLLVSVVAVAVIYGIFVTFLSVPLPTGALGIL
jgi:putative tricarboxylic transport membrane protein